MNWEAIGAVGEIVGAVGVILSLAYLALQIRHSSELTRINTKSMQATAYQQLIDHHSNLSQHLTTNPELFGLLMRAEHEGLDALSPLDQNRWEMYAASSLRSYLNGYYLHQEQLITDEQFNNFAFGLSTMAKRPAFAAWWQSEKGRRGFPEAFAQIVDDMSKA